MNELGLGLAFSPDLLDTLADPFGTRARERAFERLRDALSDGDPLGVRAVTGALPRLRGALVQEAPAPPAPTALPFPQPDPCALDLPAAHLEREFQRMTDAAAKLKALEEEARRREVEDLREERDRAVAALALRAALNGEGDA